MRDSLPASVALRAVAHAGARKSRAVPGRVARASRLLSAAPQDLRSAPPVLVNSFPKSGTHLLFQLAAALPRACDYGTFVASVPPVRHRPRSPRSIERRLGRLAPGEVARAHLWHSERYADLLRARNAVHLFVYRDLRDVVVSETHYLTEMAPWHALHRRFAALDSFAARLLLCIRGLDPGDGPPYPDVGERFRRYAGWRAAEGVVAIRYEDLTSEAFDSVAARIGEAYAERAATDSLHDFAAEARAAVDPRGSHTFRRGRPGAWREVFQDEHREAMKACAGRLLVELGYEEALDW